MAKLPAIHLYPGDWLRDPVAGCSLEAQGLWLRMMFIMHDSERYGYLVNNGSPIPPGSIARRCGCTPEQYDALLIELQAAGVPSTTEKDVIFSRRMVRDAKERDASKGRVEKHRMKRSCNADVTPNEDEIEKEGVVVGFELPKPDYKPVFLLEDFDPQVRFQDLCAVYPKPNRSYLGLQAYQRAIEGYVCEKHPDRNKIADAIEQAAAAYMVAKRGTEKKFIPELIAWLDKGIWSQDPAVWEDSRNGDGQRKQSAGDRFSAALRGANATHGEQLEKP